MSYSIVADKLVGPNVAYVGTSKKTGGILKPLFLTLHYTATDDYASDVRTLSTSSRPASCQLVLSPEGHWTQIGDFNDILWHAGVSSWKGYVGLNKYSIGIEVTCPGPIDRDQARYGKKLSDGKPYDFTTAREPNGGAMRKWAIYTDAQVDAIKEVGVLLMTHYGMKEAVGHHQIAPDRKIDPGPSCPVSLFQYLNGDRDNEPEPERPEMPVLGKLRVVGVSPETLMFRASPAGARRGELHEKAIVEELGRSGNWVNVRTPAGYVGWVYGEYLEKVA